MKVKSVLRDSKGISEVRAEDSSKMKQFLFGQNKDLFSGKDDLFEEDQLQKSNSTHSMRLNLGNSRVGRSIDFNQHSLLASNKSVFLESKQVECFEQRSRVNLSTLKVPERD